ncbi:MAG: helix-turn-helix transcriptional regulator, partial [Pyrinomonadaceae bacterium]|nr:helix-turn-helix transcriptional regulator [Sphingobacteriaceae bacterium]
LLTQQEKMYGYEITQRVKAITGNKIEISEGALYPALHKLEATGTLKTEKVTIGNRARIYYKLTRRGKNMASTKLKEMHDFIDSLTQLMSYKIA